MMMKELIFVRIIELQLPKNILLFLKKVHV